MSLEVPASRFRERKLITTRGDASVWLQRQGNKVEFHQSRPNGGGTSYWVKCDQEHCFGEAVVGGKCFAHVNEEERIRYIKNQESKNQIISLRGILADKKVLIDVFGSTKLRDSTISLNISFGGAEVVEPLHFHGVTFEGQFDFYGAIISAPFSFHGCHFKRNINGSFAFFNSGPPSWTECEFEQDVNLSYTHAERVSIGLERCKLKKSLNAEGTAGAFLMNNTICDGSITFANSTSTAVSMRETEVIGPVDLSDVNLQSLHAHGANFSTMFQFGPSEIKHCYLSRVVFNSRIRMELNTTQLDLDGALFAQGGTIILEGGELILDRVSANRRLLITGATSDDNLPSILSMQDTDTNSITLARLSLKECKFHGAHNLGSLSLESSTELHFSPQFANVKRRCIAEEIQWRAKRKNITSKLWLSLIPKKDDKVRQECKEIIPLLPRQIAVLYRDLRRGLEARADQPGAADFYYGEMEMRRHDSDTSLSDRLILTLYWLTSGYGLRASRSFLLLFTLVVIATVALQKFGFTNGPVGWSTAWLYVLKSVLPGFKSTGVTLTFIGECIEIAVRFVSPILLALFFLALRGRVKR